MADTQADRNKAQIRLAAHRRAEIVDLSAILMVLRRRALLFAVFAILFFAAVIVAYLATKPTYTATAQVILNTQRSNIISAQQQAIIDELPPNFAIDTEIEIIRSHDLAQQVVQDLKLNDTAEGVLGNLSVGRTGTSFAINISYSAHDPKYAAKMANAFAARYIVDQVARKQKVAAAASQWVQDRLKELEPQVLAAEKAVGNYEARSGLNIAPDPSGGMQEIARVQSDLAIARADLAEKEAALRSARTSAGTVAAGQDVGAALSSNVITQLRAQRAAVSTRVAELASNYGDKHPSLVEARQQLATLDRQIADEVGRVISSLEGPAQVARARVASLEASLNRLSSRLASNNSASVELQQLKSNATTGRSQLDSLAARYSETSRQSDLEPADARILTVASVPARPSSPSASLFAAIALTGSIAAGAVAVALREMLDRSLRTPDAIMKELGLSTLASVPSFKSIPNGKLLRTSTLSEFLTTHPFSVLAESFRMLQASLNGLGSPQVIAITSALPAEGKTTVAHSLARTAALGDAKVVFVECDTRRDVRNAIQGRPAVGLIEVLQGEVTLEAALMHEAGSTLSILPLSNRPLDPSHTIDGAGMDRLLEQLRSKFDIVILDLAPTLAIAEARLVAAKADACCLTVRWGTTPTSAAATALQMLEDAGANVIGAVLSQVDLKKQSAWSRNDPTAYFKSVKGYYS